MSSQNNLTEFYKGKIVWISLFDGNFKVGTIVSDDDNFLHLKSDTGEQISLAKDVIKKIELKRNFGVNNG